MAIKSILILTSDGTPPPLDLQSIQDGFDTLILSTTKVGSLHSRQFRSRGRCYEAESSLPEIEQPLSILE